MQSLRKSINENKVDRIDLQTQTMKRKCISVFICTNSIMQYIPCHNESVLGKIHTRILRNEK